MKEDLRIIFMGTPQFAVITLNKIIVAGYNVVGVVTAPDRPAGRGQKVQASDVKIFAEKHNLNVLQPTNLKDSDFLKELTSLNANLQIVVAFRMLPKAVWQMPKYGTFNLHASLLPDYRGAAPIHWAIINGEKKTGVTTFFIDDKIDTGAIILQDEISISDNETVGSLHDKLMELGSRLVIKTVNLIESDNVETTIQISGNKEKSAFKLNKENSKINWDEDLMNIYNKIRGLNPFPAAWCYFKNNEEMMTVKLFETSYSLEVHNMPAGEVVKKDSKLWVAVKNGFIILEEIQLPGKRKMATKSLLNGYQISKDAKML